MNATLTASTTTTLPEGFTARAGRLDDYLSASELVNAYAEHINGQVELTDPEVIHLDWQSPGFNPETDIWVVFGPDGKMVAFIECWQTHQPPTHPWNWVCVHPDYFDRGLWEYLLEWGEIRSAAALEKVPLDVRVAPWTGSEHNNPALARAAGQLGWKYIRSFYRMQVDLLSQPEVPLPPEGITIRAYNPVTELEAVYRAMDEAFRDHFGFVEQPFDSGFAEFKHHFLTDPGYDPAFWFVAMDGDEIAGISLCRLESMDDPHCGFVNELAVRRPWRKRGLGLALLMYSFAAFYARGQKKAALGVDASNLTGALRLYERAGMRPVRQFDNYEKELRPGREIATEELV